MKDNLQQINLETYQRVFEDGREAGLKRGLEFAEWFVSMRDGEHLTDCTYEFIFYKNAEEAFEYWEKNVEGKK